MGCLTIDDVIELNLCNPDADRCGPDADWCGPLFLDLLLKGGGVVPVYRDAAVDVWDGYWGVRVQLADIEALNLCPTCRVRALEAFAHGVDDAAALVARAEFDDLDDDDDMGEDDSLQ